MHHVTRRGVPLIIWVLILVGALIICSVIFNTFSSYLQGKNPSLEFPNQHPKVHKVVENLSSPTSMAFIDNNKLLVLERSGSVRLISDGILHDQPVLTVPVDTDGERGSTLQGALMMIQGQTTWLDLVNSFHNHVSI
jgi:glucose/arabinose dehydrogenase